MRTDTRPFILQEKYKTIEKLNHAWGAGFSDWKLSESPERFVPPEGFDAPIMIGEFHFGTITERGVWGGGLCTAMDIEHAASLFENYFRDAVKNPLIVGAHWFKFSDQPLTGRADGENYRIGFVDVADTRYPEMVEACRHGSAALYSTRIKE